MTGPILVTGSHGFVGRHLQAELADACVPSTVDVTDVAEIAREVAAVQPAAVVHLAAVSSVGGSWDKPAQAWSVNVAGTVNVIDALLAEQPSARLLFVSAAEVYGQAQDVPTSEDAPVAPLSPYAASKAAAEVACERAARRERLDVVVVRSFPHIGPGQDERFAVGSWTRQIARLEEMGGGTLAVGDLSVERDLIDVRDVVCAYRLLLDSRVPAGTYNVASGTAVPLAEVVDRLVAMAECPIEVMRDERRLRPLDLPVLCGDASRLAATTGWKPQVPLNQTLSDALEDARQAVAQASFATER